MFVYERFLRKFKGHFNICVVACFFAGFPMKSGSEIRLKKADHRAIEIIEDGCERDQGQDDQPRLRRARLSICRCVNRPTAHNSFQVKRFLRDNAA